MKCFPAVSIALVVMLAMAFSTPATAAEVEIQMDSEKQLQITRMIRGAGYYCPLAQKAWYMGEDVWGKVVKVFCGQYDKPGADPNLAFRVTIRSETIPADKRVGVVRWRD